MRRCVRLGSISWKNRTKDGTTVASIEFGRSHAIKYLCPRDRSNGVSSRPSSPTSPASTTRAPASNACKRNLKRYRASVLKAAVEGRLVPTEAELARSEGRDYEPASRLLSASSPSVPPLDRTGGIAGAKTRFRATQHWQSEIHARHCLKAGLGHHRGHRTHGEWSHAESNTP